MLPSGGRHKLKSPLPRSALAACRVRLFAPAMLRRFALFAALPAFLFLSTGCLRKEVARADAAVSPALKILRIGNYDEPQDLDPHAINGEPEFRIVMALFEG